MKSEYKRDINGNYLVLYENEEPDTSSYQMRMLVGNTIPSFLKCRVQGVDGQFMVCFDITSKQSVLTLYEEKKMGYEDLQMILGGFVQVMEEISEYLLNPCRLILKPEYMYVDVERRQLYFCYLPGYDQDIRQKFQELTEYILPLLDHEDQRAVMLGYGIYRRALEDSFHLEYIKKELYLEREKIENEETIKTETVKIAYTPEKNEKEDQLENSEALMWVDADERKEEKASVDKRKESVIWFGLAALLILGVAAAVALGYFPGISVEMTLGALIAAMGIGMLCSWLMSVKKKKEEKKENTAEDTEKYNRDSLETFNMENTVEKHEKHDEKDKISILQKNLGETMVLSANIVTGPATLVSREPGELATIYLQDELTVIGKMETAADAVVNLPTVSRIHAKIRKRGGEYYLTDLNSRNGTSVNGKMLKGDEEYCLQDQDEVDFAQARYVFLK